MAGRIIHEWPTNGGRRPTADIPMTSPAAYISPMSPDIENHIDWTAASTPQGEGGRERVAPSLSPKPAAARAAPATKRGVMETLLGENNLAALDESGRDPYNATGRQFRR
jgi:hypothetical protein